MMVGHPGNPPLPTKLAQTAHPMKNDQILSQISEFCRRANMAESTFGRRAVNDGKFVSRLRDGARITPETLVRVSEFLTTLGVAAPASPPELVQLMHVAPAPASLTRKPPVQDAPSRNFRFFDNRQKY